MKAKHKWYDILLNIVLSIGIVFVLILLSFKLFFIKVVVNGESMNPNIQDGSIGYMVKVNRNSNIERFDVVVSQYDQKDDYYIIKRVLGLPGEIIDLVNNELYVNNVLTEQNFTFIERKNNFSITHYELKENEYLLVGDNRNHTIAPAIEEKSSIIAKNGFSYAKYDVTSSSCDSYTDYSSCPIDKVKIYKFNPLSLF
ncbi:MAG: signal peptidase I [Erysipelotrichaceae bacterium]|nr:signal peptidase I [Erysipelotrichaceae bacterium]